MKLVLIAGARPNFMKIAPILRAIEKHNARVRAETQIQTQTETKIKTETQGEVGQGLNLNLDLDLNSLLVHTGQHYDYEMSKVFFEDLELPEPDEYLGVGSGTHAEQTSRTMIEVEKVLLRERPDLVVVVGDVNATLAAALAAAKLCIPVAHVEAGVRCYDMTMPEEINRLLVDHISDYLFTTSKSDDDNLRKEGITKDRVFRVGNVMADSLLSNREMASKSDILSRLGLERQGYALLTLHRPANVDDSGTLSSILEAVADISRRIPVLFPVHPRTRKSLDTFGLGGLCGGAQNRLILTEPLGYLSFLNLEMNARLVLTDSGGMQVETTVLGVPCLTLLDSPVWPITHEQGTNTLVGSSGSRLLEEATRVLDGEVKTGRCPDLWDGKAAERIVDIIAGGRAK